MDKYAKELIGICKSRDIDVKLGHELVEIRPEKRQAVFKKLLPEAEKGQLVVESYSFLHVTPPMGPPPFIAARSD